MASAVNNIEELFDKDEKLIDIWGRRNPKFERKYEQSVIRIITDYGNGASEQNDFRGKVLGAGYEAYIMSFLIGLYSNMRLHLSDETKVLGQPIQYWGNLDSKRARKAYPQLRSYIFIALVARTEIDWIALDKGDIKVPTVISKLLETMEEYANYGFSVMEDKLNREPNYFFSNRSFLDIFMQLTTCREDGDDETGPESL